MKKITMPKLNIRLSLVLWVVFAAVILAEGWIVYQSLNGGSRTVDVGIPPGSTVIRVDLASYQNALDWIAEKDRYSAPDFVLESGDLGRENPFAEY